MTARHDWRVSHCLGPIKVCNRCPDIWWVWHRPAEPTTACVPIEDVPIDYAVTQAKD